MSDPYRSIRLGQKTRTAVALLDAMQRVASARNALLDVGGQIVADAFSAVSRDADGNPLAPPDPARVIELLGLAPGDVGTAVEILGMLSRLKDLPLLAEINRVVPV